MEGHRATLAVGIGQLWSRVGSHPSKVLADVVDFRSRAIAGRCGGFSEVGTGRLITLTEIWKVLLVRIGTASKEGEKIVTIFA